MTKQQKQVKEFMIGIPNQAKDIPSKITMPSLEIRKMRARLILEEVFELINNGLGLCIFDKFLGAEYLFQDLDFFEVINKHDNMIQIADGIADIQYVTEGLAVVCGIDMEPIHQIVHENNMLKLSTGTIREDGKLVKAPNHPKPNIEGELRKQGWLK